jgi:hypothetical protein
MTTIQLGLNLRIISSRLALAKLHGAIITIIVIFASIAGAIVYYSALQSSQNQSPANHPSSSPTPSNVVQPSPNPTSNPTPIPTVIPTATPTNTPIDQTQLAIISVIPSINYTISSTLTSLINDMPRNPNSTSYYQAKITLLQDPNLYSKIVNGNFFVVDFVSSINGRQMPIVAVFPASDMRVGAAQAVQWVKSGIPFLESFMALPIPRNQITIWYGFQIGNAGGGGAIWAEDQATYESRFRAGMMPYEPLYYHELSHSYIGHESLNQFLELYQYNLVHTGSTAYADWTNFRVPKENWPWINAVLDIYQLIGHDAMANAYRTLYTMNPPYGQPLSQQCQQVFVDQAPADLKLQVATLAAKITY